MPKVVFLLRFVFDYDFYEKTIKEYTKTNPRDKPTILTKLMYINAKSREHEREHNVMSEKTFNKILTNNPSMPRDLLSSSFCHIEVPEIEKIQNEIERTIKYAIHLLEHSPHKTTIFTSPEKESEYLDNSHYKGVKDINVKSGKEALDLINSYWEQTGSRY